MKAFETLPVAQSCRLVDFKASEITSGPDEGDWFLTVRGETPCLNMKVDLNPLIYVDKPDFWGIEVVGCLPSGICLDAIGHFAETIFLNGAIGKQGIEVIGASRRERHKIPS
jgi:hypothetical protein